MIPLQGGGWRLQLPAGAAGQYRLAQVDDYGALARRAFPWQPGVQLSLRARVSARHLPGTWGFGLWNDPFSASLGLGGMNRSLPALPQAAWFFHASPPNYLSLRDDLPAQGMLAAVFRSARLPMWLLAPGLLLLPALAFPPASRLLRRLARRFVRQETALLGHDPAEWHDYGVRWGVEGIRFSLDGAVVGHTRLSPCAPLALVIWIDNQYAAWTPQGRLASGSLANEGESWLEIESLGLSPLDNPLG